MVNSAQLDPCQWKILGFIIYSGVETHKLHFECSSIILVWVSSNEWGTTSRFGVGVQVPNLDNV